jgi:hypothetical protein
MRTRKGPLAVERTVSSRASDSKRCAASFSTASGPPGASGLVAGRPRRPVACGARGSQVHTWWLAATSIKNTSPKSSSAEVKAVLLPYTSSPPIQPWREPRARAASIISRANSVLVRCTCLASGIFAFAQRFVSAAQASGKNSRKGGLPVAGHRPALCLGGAFTDVDRAGQLARELGAGAGGGTAPRFFSPQVSNPFLSRPLE